MHRKGQAISLDFVVSLAVAVLILAYFVILWSIFSDRYYDFFRKDSAETALLAVSDALVSSPGYPDNWTLAPNESQMIGLAKTQNVLDPEKVAAFFNMTYNDTKRILGLQQDFFIEIVTPYGFEYGESGMNSTANRTLSEMSRIAMLNGETVWVKVRIYGQ